MADGWAVEIKSEEKSGEWDVVFFSFYKESTDAYAMNLGRRGFMCSTTRTSQETAKAKMLRSSAQKALTQYVSLNAAAYDAELEASNVAG